MHIPAHFSIEFKGFKLVAAASNVARDRLSTRKQTVVWVSSPNTVQANRHSGGMELLGWSSVLPSPGAHDAVKMGLVPPRFLLGLDLGLDQWGFVPFQFNYVNAVYSQQPEGGQMILHTVR